MDSLPADISNSLSEWITDFLKDQTGCVQTLADVSEVKASLSQSVSFSHKHTDTQWKAAPSDPLHIAEDEDEQGPEENSDDSGPDEDYDLHTGFVTWTLTERKKRSHVHQVSLDDEIKGKDADILNTEYQKPLFPLTGL